MPELKSFDTRAAAIKTSMKKSEGKIVKKPAKEGVLSAKQVRENILLDLPEAVRQANTMRAGTNDRRADDISLSEFVQEKWGFGAAENGSPDSFYEALGLNPSNTTIENLMTMPDFDNAFRWLIPEVIREAVRLGLRKNPVYPSLIAAEETVMQPTVIMPHVNLSDATPTQIGEAETIPVGTTSYGQKSVKLHKYGTGLKVTDEVQQYVSLPVLSMYLQDVGVRLNLALDTSAVDTLLNGDQADGSESAAVIGVEDTTPGFQYYDLLRAWIRMSRLGRLPQGIISNESPALKILQMEEFKGFAGQSKTQTINIQTPVPASQNYWIHGSMPSANKLALVDALSAMIKLNASALRVETDRIAERQVSGSYVTLTTGFATLFRDARLVIDQSIAFSGNSFPDWMDVGSFENNPFK